MKLEAMEEEYECIIRGMVEEYAAGIVPIVVSAIAYGILADREHWAVAGENT